MLCMSLRPLHRLREISYGNGNFSFCTIVDNIKRKGMCYGFLDFYAGYGFAFALYNDRIWEIFFEKGAERNQCVFWIPDIHVYEE